MKNDELCLCQTSTPEVHLKTETQKQGTAQKTHPLLVCQGTTPNLVLEGNEFYFRDFQMNPGVMKNNYLFFSRVLKYERFDPPPVGSLVSTDIPSFRFDETNGSSSPLVYENILVYFRMKIFF